jgi:hypothetical protein
MRLSILIIAHRAQKNILPGEDVWGVSLGVRGVGPEGGWVYSGGTRLIWAAKTRISALLARQDCVVMTG